MSKPQQKIMGLATASGKVGMVILRGNQLLDWQVSKVAARSEQSMERVVRGWLTLHTPALVTTETMTPYSRKSDRTRSLMRTAERVISATSCEHITRPRHHTYANKYDEIAGLAQLYPAIAPWAPEVRKCYDPEPLNTILFEALALATANDR